MRVQIYKCLDDRSNFYIPNSWKSKPGPKISQSLFNKIQETSRLEELYNLSLANITLDTDLDLCYSLGIFSYQNHYKRNGKLFIKYQVRKKFSQILFNYQALSDNELGLWLYEVDISEMRHNIKSDLDYIVMSSSYMRSEVAASSRMTFFRVFWMILKYEYLI